MARALLAALCVLVALCLHGCEVDQEQSCYWSTGNHIKGCPYDTWWQCIADCTNCVADDLMNPDHCASLACASTCAGIQGGECLANFKELCNRAKPRHGCDINCDAAPAQFGFAALLLAVALNFDLSVPSVPRRQNLLRAVLLGSVALVALTMHGCCEDEALEPFFGDDIDDLKVVAGQEDSNGVWLGSPTMQLDADLTQSRAYCIERSADWNRQVTVTDHDTALLDLRTRWDEVKDDPTQLTTAGGFCTTYLTTSSEPCTRIGVGMLRCVELNADESDCERWSRMERAADQEVKRYRGNDKNNREVAHEPKQTGGEYKSVPFPPKTFFDLLDRVERDRIGTWYAVQNHQEFGDETQWYGQSDPKSKCTQLHEAHMKPRSDCDEYTEIVLFRSDCSCTERSVSEPACARWQCADVDSSMFGTLFHDAVELQEYMDVQIEESTCTTHSGQHCIEWLARGKNRLYATLRRCKCDDEACSSYKCDHWGLPITPAWSAVDSSAIVAVIIMPILTLFFACGAALEENDPCSVCVAITMVNLAALPFIVICTGVFGFLYAQVIPIGAICLCLGLGLGALKRSERPTARRAPRMEPAAPAPAEAAANDQITAGGVRMID